jgi:hypothetical protein
LIDRESIASTTKLSCISCAEHVAVTVICDVRTGRELVPAVASDRWLATQDEMNGTRYSLITVFRTKVLKPAAKVGTILQRHGEA